MRLAVRRESSGARLMRPREGQLRATLPLHEICMSILIQMSIGFRCYSRERRIKTSARKYTKGVMHDKSRMCMLLLTKHHSIWINQLYSFFCLSHEKVSTPFSPFKWWFVYSGRKICTHTQCCQAGDSDGRFAPIAQAQRVTLAVFVACGGKCVGRSAWDIQTQ